MRRGVVLSTSSVVLVDPLCGMRGNKLAILLGLGSTLAAGHELVLPESRYRQRGALESNSEAASGSSVVRLPLTSLGIQAE